MLVTQAYLDLLDKTVAEFVDNKTMFTAYDITVYTREQHKIELKHTWVRDQIHKLPAIQNAFHTGYERTVCDMYECNNCGRKFLYEETFGEFLCPKCSADHAHVVNVGNVLLYHPTGEHVSDYKLGSQTPNAPAPKRDLAFEQKNMDAYKVGDFTPLSDVIQNLRDSVNHPKDMMKFRDSVMPLPQTQLSGWMSENVSLDYRNRLEVSSEVLKIVGFDAMQDAFIIPDPNGNVIQITSAVKTPSDAVVCTQKLDRDGKLLLPNRILQMAGLYCKKFEVKNVVKDGIALVEIRGVN